MPTLRAGHRHRGGCNGSWPRRPALGTPAWRARHGAPMAVAPPWWCTGSGWTDRSRAARRPASALPISTRWTTSACSNATNGRQRRGRPAPSSVIELHAYASRHRQLPIPRAGCATVCSPNCTRSIRRPRRLGRRRERSLTSRDCTLRGGDFASRPTVETPDPGLVLAATASASTCGSRDGTRRHQGGPPPTGSSPAGAGRPPALHGAHPRTLGAAARSSPEKERPDSAMNSSTRPGGGRKMPLQPIPTIDGFGSDPPSGTRSPQHRRRARRSQRRPSGNWYAFAASTDLRADRPFGTTVGGAELVAWRDERQRLRVGPGACPHLGAALEHRARELRHPCLRGTAAIGNEAGWAGNRCQATTTVCSRGSGSTRSAARHRSPARRPGTSAAEPHVAAITRLVGICEPADIVANRLDPGTAPGFTRTRSPGSTCATPPEGDCDEQSDRFLVTVTFRVAVASESPSSPSSPVPTADHRDANRRR